MTGDEESVVQQAPTAAVDANEDTQTAPFPHSWQWLLVRGVLTLGFGVFVLFFPFTAVFALAFLFAVFAFADGATSLAKALRGRQQQSRWALAGRGVLGIFVGLAFLAAPLVATATYALVALAIFSVWAITNGVFEVLTALRLRAQLSHEWIYAASGAVTILLGAALIIVAVVYPTGFLALAWIVGIYAMIAGLAVIGRASHLRWVVRQTQSRPPDPERAKPDPA